jgi:replicative DNA helicase
MNIEKLILKNLIHNEPYVRKVLPFLKEEYFLNENEKILFQTLNNFIIKYNNVPTHDALIVEIESMSLQDSSIKNILDTIRELDQNKEQTSNEWLLDNTEKFCQEKAIYNAIMHSINILNGDEKKQPKGAIPQILSDALAVSFDPNVGHDYLEDFKERFDAYHRVEEKIPFDLEYMNKITKNGIPRKTLNIILAGTGVGKSLFMCHTAAACLNQGKNVLYITLELAEVEVAKRIDANLLNLSFDDLLSLSNDIYEKKVNNIKNRTNGKLIVKEYPTASASAIHFKALLNELYLKKSFKPDIIFIDYINICTSSRIKPGSQFNSYTFVKSIAEELRGLAVEYDVPIFSATQTTRAGFNNSNLGLEDTSESFGLPATADFMVALISNEELEKLNQIMIKQLKNRYASIETNKRFVIGIDRSKMKLYDAEKSAQLDIIDSGQTPPVKDKFRSLKV